MTVTRRSFIRTISLAVPAAAAVARAGDARPVIRAGLIVPSGTGASLVAGARFGADEAVRTAALFQREFILMTAEVENAEEAAREAARMREAGVVAVIGGVTDTIAEELGRSKLPFVAIFARANADAGVEGAYRISPTAAQYGETVARAKVRDGRAVAWHPTLNRYGAGELNERFRNETGAAMDEEAWFGWIAVKLVLESALRSRELGATRLDGHKGKLLQFDETGVLRQPLYVVVTGDGKETVID